MKDVLINGEMLCHMAMSKEHIRKTRYTIDCPGNILHGKYAYVETVTPKKDDFEWGEPEHYFYVEHDMMGFEDYNEFIAHYKLYTRV